MSSTGQNHFHFDVQHEVGLLSLLEGELDSFVWRRTGILVIRQIVLIYSIFTNVRLREDQVKVILSDIKY